jgi:hypothetical protein
MGHAAMNFPVGVLILSVGLRLAQDAPQPSPPAVDEAACEASLAALSSASADTRERAARMLHERCSRSILVRDPATAATLRTAVESGSGAAAILLLGNFRDAESIRVLQSVPSIKPVKLRLSSAPVPAPLVAAVALAHAGQPGPLETAVHTRSLAELEFLLDVLGDFEPGPAMRTLADTTLADEREVAGGVPSGARPRRRLCDVAVDAFAARLRSDLGFPPTPSRRYPPERLAEARAAIQRLLPR